MAEDVGAPELKPFDPALGLDIGPLDALHFVEWEPIASGSALLVSTRKGTWMLVPDTARANWKLTGPIFLGHIVQHTMLDPRDGRTMLIAAQTGHLGPTVFRSTDGGVSWKEASKPPAFAKAAPGETGRSVHHVFHLVPGHESQPDVWYAGASPQSLFRSEDGGDTWAPINGFNNDPRWLEWTGGEQDGTPDGPMLHSILIDPRDPNHMYIGMSGGGVSETTDAGETWTPLNSGMSTVFEPPYPEYGPDFDPHCVQMHPQDPDILYQQNHCGIYRLQRPSSEWVRIGNNMPSEVGDIGFSITLHPRDTATAWVFPMDGTGVWPRTSPAGSPAVYRTRDSGASWERHSAGLPEQQAWYTVMRQAMTEDGQDPLGIYFGTTSGEVWASTNEGESWTCLASHLPRIFAVEAVEFRE